MSVLLNTFTPLAKVTSNTPLVKGQTNSSAPVVKIQTSKPAETEKPKSNNSTPLVKGERILSNNSTPLVKGERAVYGEGILSALSSAYASAPTYRSRYEKELSDLYEKIVTRPDFSYDASSDPLYKQYEERYRALGKSAMEDTVGKAAALTGGYGNTYGTVAGAKQYDLWLDKLSDAAAGLYDRAYSRYRSEGDSLSDQYKLLLSKENADYDRYRDEAADYQKKLTLLQSAAEKQYEAELENYWKSLNYALTLSKQKG